MSGNEGETGERREAGAQVDDVCDGAVPEGTQGSAEGRGGTKGPDGSRDASASIYGSSRALKEDSSSQVNAGAPRAGRDAAKASGADVRDRAAELGGTVAQRAGQILSDIATSFKEIVSGMPTREAFLNGAFLLAFLVVVCRLAWLQSCKTGAYSVKAKNESLYEKKLPHRRGGIYDRNGNVLARSVDVVDIGCHPSWVAAVGDDAAESDEVATLVANLLASELGGDAGSYKGILTNGTDFSYVKKSVDPDVADSLRDALTAINYERLLAGKTQIPVFEYDQSCKRLYPMGQIAGNVVGCVGSDGNGLTGLELYYNDILSGTDGYLIQESNSSRTSPVVGGVYERVDPVDGENVIVSIDVDIQRVAQEQLAQVIETWNAGDGCVVVMQPETGELLACCSTPFLDPSDFSQSPTEAFNLRCVSDAYEPGSTIKPVTASMAVDLGIANANTTYYAPARIEVGDDSVGDADKRDYAMDMSLRNMLERSSNVGAVLCAESVGAAQFSAYLEKYQIGHLTGVDYPGEAVGIVPALKDYTGAWAAMAYGQAISMPPVQMARAIGAIANEGILMHPHFAINVAGEDVAYDSGERVISTSAAEEVAEMMYSVTENGYGYPGHIDGYRLSTKTGTAERAAETGGYLNDQFTVSFIGFGPTDDPKVLVYVLVDYVPEGSGSETAGGPWAVIMQEALNKLQVSPSY